MNDANCQQQDGAYPAAAAAAAAATATAQQEEISLQSNQNNNAIISNVNEQQSSEQMQTNGGVAKLTPEQEEEIKLRVKYPNPQRPGGSAFIQKMLHRGSKKYFDSGDYNMARSKTKALLNNNNSETKPSIAENISTTPNTLNPQNELVSSPIDIQSPTIIVADSSQLASPNAASGFNANTSDSILNTNLSKLSTPIMINNNGSFNNHHYQNSTNSLNVNTNNSLMNSTSNSTSPLSSSTSSTNLLNPNNYYLNTNQISTSLSTHSLSMLSSSISSDKLSNIQINTTNPSCMLDSEEIGHGIPTPECLPQSRKHSIVQSKLATPRLSTS